MIEYTCTVNNSEKMCLVSSAVYTLFRLGAWSCKEPVDSTAISRVFVSSKRGLLGTPEFRKLDPKSPSTPVVKKYFFHEMSLWIQSSRRINIGQFNSCLRNGHVIEFIHFTVHVAVNATSINKQIRYLLIFTKLHMYLYHTYMNLYQFLWKF